ncbi:4-hydroxythreonine-4-phosphate dehydrogenase PdxA [uncultured Marinobacter sp.]|uniref:PdxA family dehydrogenase n=1 Tax=uncultured Marinobacter sp. TaxID=187379 RepID=UPI0030DADB0C
MSTERSKSKPRIALPLGDPAGIGPEIVLKVLADVEMRQLVDFHVVGEAAALKPHIKAAGINVDISEDAITIAGFPPVQLHTVSQLGIGKWSLGEISALTGRACYEYARAAIRLAIEGSVDAVVAAPHTEVSVHEAGINFSGYPGQVALETGTPLNQTFLMLMSPVYRVVHVTLHESLSSALGRLTEDRILNALVATREALTGLGIPEGRIAVCGINPHAGENGAMGFEDQVVVEPAVVRAKALGVNAFGPYSADALFADREYDAYLAMYHDQGHIPVKAVSPRQASAITIGTPLLFGSVAHGSALDIAGIGKANPEALKQAIRNLTP